MDFGAERANTFPATEGALLCYSQLIRYGYPQTKTD